MASLIVFLIQFVYLYLFQSRQIYGGDSAEYFLSNRTWSIPHPPGYPFYSFLGNVTHQLLFFLPDYFRANFWSIIPTLLAAFFLQKTIRLLTKNNFLAFALSFLYLALFPIWLYASIPEVFALNNFLIILITFLILKYNQNLNKNYQLLIYFLLGLCVAHHHTFVLFLPGWYFLLKKNQIAFFHKNVGKNILYLLLGASFYLYAPIASFFNPPIDWENAKTIIGFLRLITRSSYGTFKSYSGSNPDFLNQIMGAFSSLIFIFTHFRLIGTVIIAAGFFYLKHLQKNVFKFVYITLIIELIFLFYTNFPLTSYFALATYERFLLAIYFLLIVIFAFGYLYLERIIKKINVNYIHNKFFKQILKFLPGFFLIAYIGIVFISNFISVKNLKNLPDFKNYAEDLLDLPKDKAIICVQSDTAFFTVTYLQHLQKYRTDVKFVFVDLLNRDYYRERLKKQYPDLEVGDLQSFFKINSQKYLLLFEKPKDIGIWVPYGLYWQYFPDKPTAQKEIDSLIKNNANLWKRYRIPIIDKNNRQYLHLQSIQQLYLNMLTTYAELLASEKKYPDAKKIIERVLSYDKNNTPALRLQEKLFKLVF